jgi:hypothetical protein
VSNELDAIHDDVRTNPEDVWDRLARLLCASATGPAKDADYLARTDLIEDLMFFHADAFIDRLETLLDECPELRADVVMAHVGGVGVGPRAATVLCDPRRAVQGVRGVREIVHVEARPRRVILLHAR